MITLDGNSRMRERRLANSLMHCAIAAPISNRSGFPPVMVRANRLGRDCFTQRRHFQPILKGALPRPRGGSNEFVIEGPQVSQPYVAMTCAVMKAFGVDVERANSKVFRVRWPYRSQTYSIEPDASAARYFWAAAAITGGQVRVEGLNNKVQGDVAFCNCLQRMGAR